MESARGGEKGERSAAGGVLEQISLSRMKEVEIQKLGPSSNSVFWLSYPLEVFAHPLLGLNQLVFPFLSFNLIMGRGEEREREGKET